VHVKTYRVAIVGAGPAGYFTALAFNNAINDQQTFMIDMFDRLPTPWGLVRSGVAPDHPKIRTVTKVFEKIASEPNYRYFGNVELGRDLHISDLENIYDVVVLATGTSLGKKLGIPGEDLPGCISAADFVPWYNGHPDYANVNPPLKGKYAIVIGAGNVAMDCGRMLALAPHELNSTDIADHALEVFHQSAIRDVTIIGRRGPEHAAFTSPELRELPKLIETDVFIREDQITDAIHRVGVRLESEKDLRANLDAMHEISKAERRGNERKLSLAFLLTPLEVLGNGRVERVKFAVNKVVGDEVVKSDEIIELPCDLLITAIGYEGAVIPGVVNERGRIANNEGKIREGVYVVGWAKRGPSGVIGTNKSDSSEVVKKILSELPATPKGNVDFSAHLDGDKIVTHEGWSAINLAEISAGAELGRPRRKVVSWSELLSLGGVKTT
jgi:ferredoxin--NADP+ reductase